MGISVWAHVNERPFGASLAGDVASGRFRRFASIAQNGFVAAEKCVVAGDRGNIVAERMTADAPI
jgi:hypothetical protein